MVSLTHSLYIHITYMRRIKMPFFIFIFFFHPVIPHLVFLSSHQSSIFRCMNHEPRVMMNIVMEGKNVRVCVFSTLNVIMRICIK